MQPDLIDTINGHLDCLPPSTVGVVLALLTEHWPDPLWGHAVRRLPSRHDREPLDKQVRAAVLGLYQLRHLPGEPAAGGTAALWQLLASRGMATVVHEALDRFEAMQAARFASTGS